MVKWSIFGQLVRRFLSASDEADSFKADLGTRMRIFLIDHHILFRKGFRLLLEAEGYTVLQDCSTVEEALSGDYEELVDVFMADIDGLNGSVSGELSRLLADYPSTPVLYLSCHYEPPIVREALEGGVHGFLLKSANTSELRRALKALEDGERYLHLEVAQQALEGLRSEPTAQFGELTEQDQRILELVAHGFNNSRIAEEVYVSVSTVKNRLRTLFQRFEVTDRTHLVMEAIKSGVLQVESESSEVPNFPSPSAK